MLRGGFADFSCRTVSVGPSKGSSRSQSVIPVSSLTVR